jgi:hypothetical protein
VYRDWVKNHTQPHIDQGHHTLGAANQDIIFDSWAKGTTTEKVGCCPLFTFEDTPNPAVLNMDLECVSMAYAKRNPVGEGRASPMPLPIPSERIDWNTAITNPGLMCRTVLGPKNTVIAKWAGCCVCVVFILTSLFGVIFLLSQSIAPWVMGH